MGPSRIGFDLVRLFDEFDMAMCESFEEEEDDDELDPLNTDVRHGQQAERKRLILRYLSSASRSHTHTLYASYMM